MLWKYLKGVSEMDACPKCGGKELAIDSVDYVTVYGVIDLECEDFEEESHKLAAREHLIGGETRCLACGYSTTNESWPSPEKEATKGD